VLKSFTSWQKNSALVVSPPDPALGNYAFPCFKLGRNPKEEAEKLKKKLILPAFISKTEVVGPYLNFFFNTSIIAKEVFAEIKKQKKQYGVGKSKKKMVIEYCGPNTNKPLHLGHVRNMALGNAMCRILSFQGNKVHPVNIINDRGVHICKSMLAYQKWGEGKTPEDTGEKGDHFVGRFYVMFNQKLEQEWKDWVQIHPEITNLIVEEQIKRKQQWFGESNVGSEARAMLRAWEANDPAVRQCKIICWHKPATADQKNLTWLPSGGNRPTTQTRPAHTTTVAEMIYQF